MMYRALILATSATLFACGEDDDKKSTGVEGTIGALTYLVTNPGTLDRSAASIKGTGAILFKEPIGDVLSEHHYQITAALEDGGDIELVTHADNALNNGIAVAWKRSATGLNVTIKADGKTSEAATVSDLDLSKPFTYKLDIHNNETPAHVLIWNQDEEEFSEDAAIVNSEEQTPGNGKGNFWGLRLNKATITAVSITEAKYED